MSPPDPGPPGWQPNWPTDDPSFQPHTAGSPGVQGPVTPWTWSNGQDPGWAPGTKPGQGGRPYGRGWSPGDSPPSPKAYDMDKKQWLYGDDPIQPATRPEGPYEANTVENERKWRESQLTPLNPYAGEELRPYRQEELLPHTAGSPGVQGPVTPWTWSNGQDPGWAPGTKPGQGGRPYGRGWSPGDSPPSPKAYDMDKKQWLYGDDPIQPATRPEGPYEANTVENERKWRESQFSPVRQPGWENRYLDFARKQEGWNPEWDDYLPQLLRYLQKPDVDPRESYHTSPVTDPGGATTAPVKMGIPRELWGQITEFGKTIPGINSREWQRSEFGGRTPQLTPYQQVPGGTEAGGQSPSVLSDLARKNAIRRQVLARLMGRPTGASSLMELMGQQQPY